MDKGKEIHPLDELFQRKLKDWEELPDPRLWLKLESGKKAAGRKKSRIIWYAAASLLAGLWAGYGLWVYQVSRNSASPAALTAEPGMPAVAAEIPEELPGLGSSYSRKEEASLAAGAGKDKAVISIPGQRATAEPVAESGEKSIAVADIGTASDHTDEAIPARGDAFFPPVEEEPVRIAGQLRPASAEVVKAPGTEEGEQTSVLIVYVESDDHNKGETRERPQRLKRFFKQLKNVKNGEPVDWEDMRFNPRKVLAKVDHQLIHPNGGISRKYKDIKEKTNF